jgi:hypothetical protein
MKTAMQELVEWIESNEIVYNKELILKLKELLEKEKEQIIDAWNKRGSTIVPRYFLEENINGEEYYNQTYNN